MTMLYSDPFYNRGVINGLHCTHISNLYTIFNHLSSIIQAFGHIILYSQELEVWPLNMYITCIASKPKAHNVIILCSFDQTSYLWYIGHVQSVSFPNSQFHAEFSRHVPISSESSRIENNLANHRTSQQQDLYFNMHCRYPKFASENVRVYVTFGYIRNFCH